MKAFTPVSERIYNAIKSELYLQLRPLEKVTEANLSERFGVSRIPVREALQRLVREGFLMAHFRSGYSIAIASQREVDELNVLRALFEEQGVLAATRSAKPPKSLGALWEFWGDDKNGEGLDPIGLSEKNRDFHSAIVAHTGNHEMVRQHGLVFDRIEVVQRLDFTEVDRVAITFAEHRRILEHLMRGDGATAWAALKLHLQESNEHVRQLAEVLASEAQANDAVASVAGGDIRAIGPLRGNHE